MLPAGARPVTNDLILLRRIPAHAGDRSGGPIRA